MIILQSHERMHTGLLGNVKVKKKMNKHFHPLVKEQMKAEQNQKT